MDSEKRTELLLKVFKKGLNLNELLNFMPAEAVSELLKSIIVGMDMVKLEYADGDLILEGIRDCILHEMEECLDESENGD